VPICYNSRVSEYQGQDLEALAHIPNYQRWILGHFQPHLHGRVLEIGAGIGTFAEKYLDSVDDAVLLEPAANLGARLRERFSGRARVKVLVERLERADLQDRSFDAILVINVLEHVDEDAAMLRRIFALLKEGGRLLLFVPAIQLLYGTLDELVGHRRRYHKSGLKQLVEASGFVVEDLRYFDALGMMPWLVAGRVLRQRRFDERAARLYDSVAVPLGALVERVVAPPLGKNLLCVAQAR
jgi:SAM-dependent methyltransferase